MSQTIDMKYLLSLLLIICASLGCKEKPVVAKEELSPVIPGLPMEIMQSMIADCDFIDYIFYELPFSLSQGDDPAIKSSLSFIGKIPEDFREIPPMCEKAIGRIFFQAKGETLAEADIYFSSGCFFYLFMKDNKPAYVTKISEAGINFYWNVINNNLKPN